MLDSIFTLLILINQSLHILVNAEIDFEIKPVASIYPSYNFIWSKENPVYNFHFQQGTHFVTKPIKDKTYNSYYVTAPSAIIDSVQRKSNLNNKYNLNFITEQRSGNIVFSPIELHHGYRYTAPAIVFSNNTNLKNVIYNELGLTENNNEVNPSPHGFALKQSQLELKKTFNSTPGNFNIKVPLSSKNNIYQYSNITTILTPVQSLKFPLKYSQAHDLPPNYTDVDILKQHNINSEKESKNNFINNTSYQGFYNVKLQNFNTANKTLESVTPTYNYINKEFLGLNLANINLLKEDRNSFDLNKLALNIEPNVDLFKNVNSTNVTTEPSIQSSVLTGKINLNYNKIISNETIADIVYQYLPQESSELNIINSNRNVNCSFHAKTNDIDTVKNNIINNSLNGNVESLKGFPQQLQKHQEEQNNNIYTHYPMKYDQHHLSSFTEHIPIQKFPNMLSLNSNKQIYNNEMYYPSSSLLKKPLEQNIQHIPTNMRNSDLDLSQSIKPLIQYDHISQPELYFENQIKNLHNYQTTNITPNIVIFPSEQNQHYHLKSPNMKPLETNIQHILANIKNTDFNLSHPIKPLIQYDHISQHELHLENQIKNSQNYQTTTNITPNKLTFPSKQNRYYSKSPNVNLDLIFGSNAQNFKEQKYHATLSGNNQQQNTYNLPIQENSQNINFLNQSYIHTDMINGQTDPRTASNGKDNSININYKFNGSEFISTKFPQIVKDRQLLQANRKNPQNRVALLSNNRQKEMYNLLDQISTAQQLHTIQENPQNI